MFDTNAVHLDGPEFLDAVAEAELQNGNLINAEEYRRRARQWRNERVQRQDEVLPIVRTSPRSACALPTHHITPSDRR